MFDDSDINVSFSRSHRFYIIIMGCFDDSDINVSFSRSHRCHIIIMGCFDDSDINVFSLDLTLQ